MVAVRVVFCPKDHLICKGALESVHKLFLATSFTIPVILMLLHKFLTALDSPYLLPPSPLTHGSEDVASANVDQCLECDLSTASSDGGVGSRRSHHNWQRGPHVHQRNRCKGNPEVNMQNAIFERDSSKLHFCLKCVWTHPQFNQVAHKREVSETLQPIFMNLWRLPNESQDSRNATSGCLRSCALPQGENQKSIGSRCGARLQWQIQQSHVVFGQVAGRMFFFSRIWGFWLWYVLFTYIYNIHTIYIWYDIYCIYIIHMYDICTHLYMCRFRTKCVVRI